MTDDPQATRNILVVNDDPATRDALILVVEDDEAIRKMLEVALRHHGFAVRLASDGEEGLALYRRYRDSIDVVLLDVQLRPGGLDGAQTLAALRELNPELPCCFMSGHTGKYNPEELAAMGAHVLAKPFGSLDQLAGVLLRLARPG